MSMPQLAGSPVCTADSCSLVGVMSGQFSIGLRLVGMAALIGAVVIMAYELMAQRIASTSHKSRIACGCALLRLSKGVMLAAVTPLLEKNVLKTLSIEVPFVFSMSRIVVLAFATGMVRQLWHAGIAGWPEATLAIAVVLALPLLGALDRMAPEQTLNLASTLLTRFGVGETRKITSTYAGDVREPSHLDDHRVD